MTMKSGAESDYRIDVRNIVAREYGHEAQHDPLRKVKMLRRSMESRQKKGAVTYETKKTGGGHKTHLNCALIPETGAEEFGFGEGSILKTR